jgi:hypothetical protein
MPAKINMNLTNSNVAFQTRQILNSAQNVVPNIKKSGPLNSSMITRVHLSRPGCGSCGK